jgi:hypothetical protein
VLRDDGILEQGNRNYESGIGPVLGLEETMVSNVRPKRILASFLVASAVALYAPVPFAAQGRSASRPSLDYEFFKTRVEPIFLKKRWPDHARCYVCHEISRHGGGPLSLERLSPGSNSWTEEQSRTNFQIVSKLVTPGNPLTSLLLLMPLAPEVGGIADTHQGGRQFTSLDDPDWKIMAEWVRGQKAGGSSAP